MILINAYKKEAHMRIWYPLINDVIRAMYAHYQSEPRLGSSPALLLIDLYNLSYKGGNKPVRELLSTNPSGCGEHAYKAIAPTQALIQLFRDRQLPVIYSTRRWYAHSEGVHSTQRQRKALTEEDYAIYEAFCPEPEDTIIYKPRASVFFDTPMAETMKELGVDSLVIAGESTSGCVRASTVEAYSHGYPPILIEECVFDRNPVSHAMNLFDMHHKYGHVMPLEAFKAHLRQKFPLGS